MFIQIFELIVIFFIDSLNAIYNDEGVDLYHILIVFLCFNSGGGYSFEKHFFPSCRSRLRLIETD